MSGLFATPVLVIASNPGVWDLVLAASAPLRISAPELA